MNVPSISVNAFVVSDPALMKTSAPLIGLYAWSTIVPVTTTVSPELMTPFSTFKSITNSHNSACEAGMNENTINNENNPITTALLNT